MDEEMIKDSEVGGSPLESRVIAVLRKYPVKRAAFFGSYARGTYDEQSDIDLLVDVPGSIGLEFYAMWDELETEVNRKIDLLTYFSVLNSKVDRFRNNIFNDLRWIYEE